MGFFFKLYGINAIFKKHKVHVFFIIKTIEHILN